MQRGNSSLALQVIIIGAGPVGLCCALELAGRGVAVTVIDSGARGAGWAAGGMLSPVHEFVAEEAPGPLLHAGLDGAQAWAGLSAQLGLKLGAPATFVAMDEGEAAHLAAVAQRAAGLGLDMGETAGPAGLRRLAAWQCPSDVALAPRAALGALRAACAQAGVQGVAGEVTQVAGGQVWLAGTQPLRADRIVLASGLGPLGASFLPTGALVPVGGQLVRLPPVAGLEGPVHLSCAAGGQHGCRRHQLAGPHRPPPVRHCGARPPAGGGHLVRGAGAGLAAGELDRHAARHW
jgi:glycine oxidase